MSDTELEAIYSRCNICLDSENDFYIRSCRDQFCRPCFNRYVEGIIKNSWGMSMHAIQCPVCKDKVDLSEWRNYVYPETVEAYNRQNKPYRPLTRFCECSNEVEFSAAPVRLISTREACYEQILCLLEELVVQDGKQINSFGFTILSQFQADVNRNSRGEKINIPVVYEGLMSDLRKLWGLSSVHSISASLSSQDPKYELLRKLSLLLTSLETTPEEWKNMSLKHVSNFPTQACNSCSKPICFPCAASHPNQTCHEHIIHMAKHDESLKWELENSKRCPRCATLIAREEGCNKVDCLVCSYSFCWSCLGTFENGKCGFYRCQITGLVPPPISIHAATHDHNGTIVHPSPVDSEAGVPNIGNIEAIWSSNSARHSTVGTTTIPPSPPQIPT